MRPFQRVPPRKAPLEPFLQEPHTGKKLNKPFWLPAVVIKVRKGTAVSLEKLHLPTQILQRKQSLCMAQSHPSPAAIDKQQIQTLCVKVRKALVSKGRHDLSCGRN